MSHRPFRELRDELAAKVGEGHLAAAGRAEVERYDDDDVSALDVFCSEPTVGYCSKCGEVRSSVYTCRDGGSTVPAAPDA